MDLPATDRFEGMEKGVTTPAHAALQTSVGRLGFTAGQVIQEFGYDSDVDDDFRFAIEDHTGTELEDEEYQDVADASLIWWRQDDDRATLAEVGQGIDDGIDEVSVVLSPPDE